MSNKYLYRVDFIGQLKGLKMMNTSELRKYLPFEGPQKYEQIVEKLHETHQYIKVLKVVDCAKAAEFNEIKPDDL